LRLGNPRPSACCCPVTTTPPSGCSRIGYTTGRGEFSRRLLRRPPIELELWETDWRYWSLFEPHHYLKLPKMIAATNYVGVVDGELVAHVGVSTRPGLVEARASRLVVMPEWQGVGVGLRFFDAVCARWASGENRYVKPMPTLFHTSHPGLAAALRRNAAWTQVSGSLCGDNKARRSWGRGRPVQASGGASGPCRGSGTWDVDARCWSPG
jgi:GNAT superfamily N-acetyltransferase